MAYEYDWPVWGIVELLVQQGTISAWSYSVKPLFRAVRANIEYELDVEHKIRKSSMKSCLNLPLDQFEVLQSESQHDARFYLML